MQVRRRPYGATGQEVSEIGFGAWQLGNARDWEGMDDEAAVALVRTALDVGVNYFDTAPGYGAGASERLLGRALEGRREGVVVNTKVGHRADGTTDFSPEGIRTSVAESLERLRMTRIDSVLLHNPPTALLDGDHPVFRALRDLREEGRIAAYGVSIDHRDELETVLARTDAQVVEILFNILHQDPRPAFSQAAKQGVALVVKVPLDSGWLSGKYGAGTRFSGVRARWSDAEIERRAALVARVRELLVPGVPMATQALAFVLAHPEVSTVIPGVRTVAQLTDNLAASAFRLPQATVDALHRLWDEVLAEDPLPW